MRQAEEIEHGQHDDQHQKPDDDLLKRRRNRHARKSENPCYKSDDSNDDE